MKKQSIVYERESGSGSRSAAKKSTRQSVRSGGYAYAAVFEKAEEGGYIVHFPAFGIATQGETIAQWLATCSPDTSSGCCATAKNYRPAMSRAGFQGSRRSAWA